jgi:DNA-binding IclR family transcriptional regulator
LFDTMAAGAQATSAGIAKRAGQNERYVREWLGAMVTERIVDYDAATKTYTLPPERSVFMTRAAEIDNLALQAQYVPLLGSVKAKSSDHSAAVAGSRTPSSPTSLDS